MIQKKILIVGGDGFVSTHLWQDLLRDHLVQRTFRSPLDKDQVKTLMTKMQPDVLIYAAGSNDILAAEKNTRLSNAIHSTGAASFMEACNFVQAKMIYISSDLVFSGMGGNFAESDMPGPTLQLGKSKLSAENQIRNNSSDYLILRCAPLLGRGTIHHPSVIDQYREANRSGEKLKIDSTTLRNPVHISALSAAIAHALKENLKNQILHIGGLTKITDFGIAKRLYPQLKAEGTGEQKIDYSLNFTDTLLKLNAEKLTIEQSLGLLR